MMRRRGRPGLLGTAARTAVIAGTATATANAVSGHQAKKAAEKQQEAAAQQQQAAPPPPPAPEPAPEAAPAPAAGITDDSIEQLKKLADLHASGVLSDAEFEAAKAKILGL